MKLKILIVDDDENSRVFLERALVKQGYRVEGVTNGAQALASVDAAPPGLIISDILMPELDGFELCRRVKTDDRLRAIPFIFYSATYVAPEDRALARKLGASRFIVKPLGLEAFSRMVEEVLAEYRQRRLPVPVRPLGGHDELDRLQLEALNRKLEQKIGELARERSARKKAELEYGELRGRVQELVREGVAEERRKDDLLIVQGRQAVMGEMINNIAHHWRQPINTLGLLAQDLQMTYKFGEFTKEFVDANVRKTLQVIQAMSKSIDEFRTFFRPDREKVDFRVLGVVSKIRLLLEGGFSARQIRIELKASGDPVVRGYPGEFSQVLLNILINARDALLQRQVDAPRVTVSVSSERGRTVILVTDNAGGIPAEVIGKVFDPYFTTKGPDQGTGIGLFMSKSIIEKNMGGRLTVRNVEGGAEFRIEL